MRPAWTYGWLGIGTLALGGAIAGCIVVTGGTNGYQLEDAGSSAVVLDAAICGCSTGEVCCAGFEQSSLGTVCVGDAGSCAFGTIQICQADRDCENASCTTQTCGLGGGFALTLQSCGVAPGCTASPVDAGSPDSAKGTPLDSGALDSSLASGG